jgi:DNA-binding response OmpR family regulator
MRILYLEDDTDSRQLIVVLLGQLGYEVVTAGTLEEGISLAREAHFDLIILDNWLDGENGIDACRQIRSFDKKTPILFYSAAAYESDIEHAISAGAQAYVVKPSVQALEEAVIRMLGR